MILHKEGLESAPAETTDEGLSFAERLLKRSCVENAEVTFIDSRFLFPTSNICERLFSKAGYALSDRRRRIAPMNFEQQIFLHANRSMWDMSRSEYSSRMSFVSETT